MQQKMEMLLVQEDRVSIAAGNVPVLELAGSYYDVCSVVNFLRSGCPAVQLFSDSPRPHAITSLDIQLKALQLPGETFDMESQSEEPSVLLVTRHITPSPKTSPAPEELAHSLRLTTRR